MPYCALARINHSGNEVAVIQSWHESNGCFTFQAVIRFVYRPICRRKFPDVDLVIIKSVYRTFGWLCCQHRTPLIYASWMSGIDRMVCIGRYASNDWSRPVIIEIYCKIVICPSRKHTFQWRVLGQLNLLPCLNPYSLFCSHIRPLWVAKLALIWFFFISRRFEFCRTRLICFFLKLTERQLGSDAPAVSCYPVKRHHNFHGRWSLSQVFHGLYSSVKSSTCACLMCSRIPTLHAHSIAQDVLCCCKFQTAGRLARSRGRFAWFLKLPKYVLFIAFEGYALFQPRGLNKLGRQGDF